MQFNLLIYFIYVPVGCEIDNEKMELMLSQVKGKDITELLAAGREKFASVPSGGGGAAVAAAAPSSGGAAPAAESKKEEKVVEKEESDDVRTLFLATYIIFYIFISKRVMLFLPTYIIFYNQTIIKTCGIDHDSLSLPFFWHFGPRL